MLEIRNRSQFLSLFNSLVEVKNLLTVGEVEEAREVLDSILYDKPRSKPESEEVH